MIFKTFNSNIDKISSKWEIFRRSFNDIGTTIVGRITDISKAFQATSDLVGSIKDSESIWKRLYPSKESIKMILSIYSITLPIASKPDESPLHRAINDRTRMNIIGTIINHLLFCKLHKFTT